MGKEKSKKIKYGEGYKNCKCFRLVILARYVHVLLTTYYSSVAKENGIDIKRKVNESSDQDLSSLPE